MAGSTSARPTSCSRATTRPEHWSTGSAPPASGCSPCVVVRRRARRRPPASRVAAVAIVELEDEIRPDAAEILAYFAEQDVTLKVISGDNPETVAAIAERAGLARRRRRRSTPASCPRTSTNSATVLEARTVFGRVKPHQKQAMVRALQSHGHVVAMTGDGVNDVLALKDADLGISMGSGSEATKAVADLVLIDNAFSSLPSWSTRAAR